MKVHSLAKGLWVIALGLFMLIPGNGWAETEVAGQNAVLLSTNTQWTLGGVGYLPVEGDYDGDRKADPAVYQESTGYWNILLSANGYTNVSTRFGGAGFTPVIGDFDGDRKNDPIVYQEATGNWGAMLSDSGYQTVSGWFGGAGFQPAVADFDGDGKTDPAVYNTSSGLWRVLLSASGYAEAAATLGRTGYTPIPADFDGDGKADPATCDDATGEWTVMCSTLNYAVVSALLGAYGTPIPADFDGDRKADPAMYQASSSSWGFMLSGSGYTVTSVLFGALSSTPVPDDFTGDGVADVAVYNDAAGIWYLAEGETPTPGAVYYVATAGNNTNTGSGSAPWATPGYGSRQLQPGDTLIIRGGIYTLREFNADIITPMSGTANAWITIKGEPGNRPTLAGQDDLLTAVDLGGKSYVCLENLEITAAEGALFRGGIQMLSAQSSNVILKDLYIHHLDEEGIDIQDVNGLLITNCIVSYCGFGAISGPAGLYGGFRNGRIVGCTLSWSGHYYQGGDGSNRPYDRPDGFGIEEANGPIEIIDTVSEHNYGDGLDSKSANTIIQRCIVANNSCDGVKLWGAGSRVENTLIYGRGDGDSTTTPWAAIVIGTQQTNATFTLVNNSVDDALGNNYLMYVQYDTPNIPVGLTMRNNIFSSRGPNASIFLAGAVVMTNEYNLYYFPNSGNVLAHGDTSYDSTQVSAMGAGNRYGDPQFMTTAWGTNGNYHVQVTSPAVDTGTAFDAPVIALDGSARPQGSGYDMGAYER